MTTLVLDGISKRFGSTVAIEHLDLAVETGELVSLLGPSGCGKTTALRIVAGFEHPDDGRLAVGGLDVSGVAPNRRNMGMVFQAYSLFPNLTVAENIAFGLRMRRQGASARRQRIAEMLDLVGLATQAGRYPHQLSGGQQQRVALARALAIAPDVLLLDEPLSALDAKVRVQLREEIRRIQLELGTTTLFVTHDQDEALAISDRVGVMSHGRLEQIGPPTEVYQRPLTAFVARFIGTMNELPGMVAGPDRVRVDSAVVGANTGGRRPGTPVRLLVRPESLQVAATDDRGASPAGWVGSVTRTTFGGATTEVTVRLDRLDHLVTATVASVDAVRFGPGSRVGVWAAGEGALVDDVASGDT